MSNGKIIRSCAIVTGLVAAACGGAAEQAPGADTGGGATGPAGPATGATEELSPPPKPWAELTLEERKGYMLQRVLPVMTAKFQDFDPDHFAGFGCQTCHGDNASEVGFTMPNPSLPELYPTGSPEQKQLVETKREWAVFMFNDVTKPMSALLGIPEYTEERGDGFTCYYCHPGGDSETHGRSPLARQRQLPGTGGEALPAAGGAGAETD